MDNTDGRALRRFGGRASFPRASWVGRLIVCSHPGVQCAAVEEWLPMAGMDAGCYTDLVLVVGILMITFASNCTWTVLISIGGSMCWVDAFRVFRSMLYCAVARY